MSRRRPGAEQVSANFMPIRPYANRRRPQLAGHRGPRKPANPLPDLDHLDDESADWPGPPVAPPRRRTTMIGTPMLTRETPSARLSFTETCCGPSPNEMSWCRIRRPGGHRHRECAALEASSRDRRVAGAADGDLGSAARHLQLAGRAQVRFSRPSWTMRRGFAKQISALVPARRRSACSAAHHGSLTKAWDAQWRVECCCSRTRSPPPDTLVWTTMQLAYHGRQYTEKPKIRRRSAVLRTMVTVPMLKDGEPSASSPFSHRDTNSPRSRLRW